MARHLALAIGTAILDVGLLDQWHDVGTVQVHVCLVQKHHLDLLVSEQEGGGAHLRGLRATLHASMVSEPVLDLLEVRELTSAYGSRVGTHSALCYLSSILCLLEAPFLCDLLYCGFAHGPFLDEGLSGRVEEGPSCLVNLSVDKSLLAFFEPVGLLVGRPRLLSHSCSTWGGLWMRRMGMEDEDEARMGHVISPWGPGVFCVALVQRNEWLMHDQSCKQVSDC